MRAVSFIAAAVLLSSTSVFAADAVNHVPEAPAASDAAPAFTWAGAYAGAQAGYGWEQIDASGAGVFVGDDFDGARLGGFAGYNWVVSGGYILGLEGDLSYDFNENSYTVSGTGLDIRSGLNGSVRARVGYGFDRALFFAAAGWTASNLTLESTGIKISDTMNGWTVGAGVDYAFTNKLFGRLEYRYNDYGDTTINAGTFETKQHVINAGVGIKF